MTSLIILACWLLPPLPVCFTIGRWWRFATMLFLMLALWISPPFLINFEFWISRYRCVCPMFLLIPALGSLPNFFITFRFIGVQGWWRLITITMFLMFAMRSRWMVLVLAFPLGMLLRFACREVGEKRRNLASAQKSWKPSQRQYIKLRLYMEKRP